ncbi:MAG: hypothetical protein K1X94_26795 [Sandaracinaceae bacterium]|jgi:hypothetical protein|nr:hypothetical protein [Sandaracinaceae bacterium]
MDKVKTGERAKVLALVLAARVLVGCDQPDSGPDAASAPDAGSTFVCGTDLCTAEELCLVVTTPGAADAGPLPGVDSGPSMPPEDAGASTGGPRTCVPRPAACLGLDRDCMSFLGRGCEPYDACLQELCVFPNIPVWVSEGGRVIECVRH